MILPRSSDAIHKMQLLRLLSAIVDAQLLSASVYFKGGTCAALLGFLDRFSLDLDFDLAPNAKKAQIDQELNTIFPHLGLRVKQKGQKALFYILRYQSPPGERNTIKLSLLPQATTANVYKPFYISEIDRYATCATIETMFSHKLVSLIDRYRRYHTIAGRDVYDIHHFFLEGRRYISTIIEERTGETVNIYLQKLHRFIEEKITETTISEDLNYLLSPDAFERVRKTLKSETLSLLADEITRTIS